MSEHILYYALGGGYGHVQRSVRVIRALQKQRSDLQFYLIGPERCAHLSTKGVTYLPAEVMERETLGRWFQQQLLRIVPNLMIVDTFPRGVLGELSFPTGLRRVLVTRSVPAAYYCSPPIFQACQEYDEILWTEPKCHPSLPGEVVEPVTVEPLGEVPQNKQVLGLSSGLYEHREEVRESFLQAFPNGQWLTGEPWETDLANKFTAASLVICAAGYNTFYEVLGSGTPAIFLPQQRKYDDQAARVRRFSEELHLCAAEVNPNSNDLLNMANELMDKRNPQKTFQGAEQIAQILQGVKK